MQIKTAFFNGVASIEMARPEKKNALTEAMYQAMADALIAFQNDAQVRAVLISGQPGIFTSGNDLEDFLQRPPQNSQAPVFQFMRALVQCDKPVVAAVTGPALGIGTTLLLHCDLVFLSDEARLALPFTRLGLVPEFASSWLLPQLMGNVRAAQALLLGDPIGPQDAVDHGLANAVLPAAEVINHARRVAERFQGLPSEAVAASKRLLRRAQRPAVLEAIEAEAQEFAQRLAGTEVRELLSGFLNKTA
jgi:enoyl-CoA hydratase/carnithine racemase